MRRQKEPNGAHQDEAPSSDRQSSDGDISDQGKIDQLLSSDQKIQELHRSVERLREFVGTLPPQNAATMPPSVEEYCDKIKQYRVKDFSLLISLAERRVNKMLRNRKIKRNWNSEDITLLVWLVSKRIELLGLNHFQQLQKNDWEFISSLIAGSTWQKCKFRWLGLKKVKLLLHKWSKIQSKLLSQAIAEQEKINWKLVSQIVYQKNPMKNKVFRTAKQCRQHWNCFLNPGIHKGPWSLQQDKKLLQFVLQLQGSKKWSEIAKFMQGRTQNALKNRFNLLINHQRKLSGRLTQKRLVKICLQRIMMEEGQERHEASSPIQSQQFEEFSQINIRENRTPIIPTVLDASTYSNNIVGFPITNYDNITGYLNTGMIANPQLIGSNVVYIGFFHQSQFL